MKTQDELKALIDFLRSEGVTSYEENGIRLTLLPQKPVEVVERDKSAAEERRVRRDQLLNLTEDEQLDLFNEVISPVA